MVNCMTPMRNGGVTAAYSHAVATIRRYRPEDLEQCRSLWADLTDWHRRLYTDESIGGADPGSGFDAHLAEVGPERIFVAELDGRVVGLAGMLISGRKVELEPLSVRAGCRGLGVGRELAETVLAAARAEGARQVVVRPTGRNAEAIRVFHALGFDIVARVELVHDLAGDERWRDGEDYAGRRFRV
jgi:ribosomal protein S18 acetylase RimI-like enzyme